MLKELLGMPDDVHFVCVITIGKQPADLDDSPLVSRLSQARLPLAAVAATHPYSGSIASRPGDHSSVVTGRQPSNPHSA